ncbi:phosphoribosylformylglycinamidine cyclo-ligase [Epidermidibacterium keratini]|uniref:Phosphoribosylformylglycinamidine cyclo-ligase n=1 Tax=Epidermidibacterium keratini TaxID=1891644 RepID=A0A7L4YMG8_9ACTN|nr:phosphoribosylformylglycinamidine cyclo-ligase [Epidermidibacterium keratini]QHC00009.1 phosphoribosylformylglycinamidine cyclo-ligase [Epidermidibacterium keratini]
MSENSTYAAAGVSLEEGDRAVELMRRKVEGASRPEVVGGLGGFAGLFKLDVSKYTSPLLASSTDGVGTKIAIAQALDKHDTIGQDLVAMVVDDIVVCGAEPLFLQDYIACGKVDAEKIAAIVGGIADGCVLAGTALVGGETAEHPGLMAPDDYDLAACATGVVEADRVLGPDRVRAGDAVIALASSGVHSNGYSLVRKVIADAQLDLNAIPEGLGRTLGEELLEPTRIYTKPLLSLIERYDVHAMCHVTGGGIPGNLPRVLPAGLGASVDRGTWSLPPIFALLAQAGGIERDELERAFNVGVGMLVVLPEADADAAVRALKADGLDAWACGQITDSGSVQVASDYRP